MIYDFPSMKKPDLSSSGVPVFPDPRQFGERPVLGTYRLFKGLFDLQELLERGDLRADLIRIWSASASA